MSEVQDSDVQKAVLVLSSLLSKLPIPGFPDSTNPIISLEKVMVESGDGAEMSQEFLPQPPSPHTHFFFLQCDHKLLLNSVKILVHVASSQSSLVQMPTSQ